MLKSLAMLLVVGSLCVSASAQTSIYVAASPSFQTSLAAALMKKHVPVTVVMDQKKADYTLQSATVDSKDESTGGKIARCLFLDCIGMNGSSEVSVELIRNKDQAIVWAYQVRKAFSGPVAIQSLSEAIAKHLKHDYLEKQQASQPKDAFAASMETP